MPIYEYECPEHGVFERERAMAEARSPAPCPVCDVAARRIISAPNLTALPRSAVLARDRNERSRHEPRVVQREARRDTGPPRARSHAGPRPWVLEHG